MNNDPQQPTQNQSRAHQTAFEPLAILNAANAEALRNVLAHPNTPAAEHGALLSLFDRLVSRDAPNVNWLFERHLEWRAAGNQKPLDSVSVSYAGLEQLGRTVEKPKVARASTRLIARILHASCDASSSHHNRDVDAVIDVLSKYRGDYQILDAYLRLMGSFNLYEAAERTAVLKQQPSRTEIGQKMRAVSGQSVRVENLHLVYRKGGTKSDGAYFGPDSYFHIMELVRAVKDNVPLPVNISKERVDRNKIPGPELPAMTMNTLLDPANFQADLPSGRLTETAKQLRLVLAEAIKLRDELALLMSLETHLAADDYLKRNCSGISGRGRILKAAGHLIGTEAALGDVPVYIHRAYGILSDPRQSAEVEDRDRIKLYRVLAGFVLSREFLPMSFAVDHLLQDIGTWEKLSLDDPVRGKYRALGAYGEHLKQRRAEGVQLSVHEMVALLKESPILEFRREINAALVARHQDRMLHAIAEFSRIFLDGQTGGSLQTDCLGREGGRLTLPKERLAKDTIYAHETGAAYFRPAGTSRRILFNSELRGVLGMMASWSVFGDGEQLLREYSTVEFAERLRNFIGADFKVAAAQSARSGSLSAAAAPLKAIPYPASAFKFPEEFAAEIGLTPAELHSKIQARVDLVPAGLKREEMLFYLSAGLVPAALLPDCRLALAALQSLQPAPEAQIIAKIQDLLQGGLILPDASLAVILDKARSSGLLTPAESQRLQIARRELNELENLSAPMPLYGNRAGSILPLRSAYFIIVNPDNQIELKRAGLTDFFGELHRFETFSCVGPQQFERRYLEFQGHSFRAWMTLDPESRRTLLHFLADKQPALSESLRAAIQAGRPVLVTPAALAVIGQA